MPLGWNPQLVETPLGQFTDSEYEAQDAALRANFTRRYQDVLRQLGYSDEHGNFIPGQVEIQAGKRRMDLNRNKELAIRNVTNQTINRGTFFSGRHGEEEGMATQPYVRGLADLEEQLPQQLGGLYEDATGLMSDFSMQQNRLLADAAARRAAGYQTASGDEPADNIGPSGYPSGDVGGFADTGGGAADAVGGLANEVTHTGGAVGAHGVHVIHTPHGVKFRWGGQWFDHPGQAVAWMQARGFHTNIDQFLHNHPELAAAYGMRQVGHAAHHGLRDAVLRAIHDQGNLPPMFEGPPVEPPTTQPPIPPDPSGGGGPGFGGIPPQEPPSATPPGPPDPSSGNSATPPGGGQSSTPPNPNVAAVGLKAAARIMSELAKHHEHEHPIQAPLQMATHRKRHPVHGPMAVHHYRPRTMP